MFSKELEALIEATLVDGRLDDLEKQALVERAEKEGVSQAELLVYINSILQKRAQTRTEEEMALEEEKYEKSLKQKGQLCPYCHAPLPPLAETCPSCGAVILTAAVNDKIEKMITGIRNSYSEGVGHSTATAGDKNQALGLLERARSQTIELKMTYSTVKKVEVFCNQMQSDIEKAIKEKKSAKTNAQKELIQKVVLGILSLILLAISFLLWPWVESLLDI